jgi:hypothetical protein
MPASRKPSKSEDRSARLRAALRENLKRRKAQAKARSTTAQTDVGRGRGPQDSAEIVPDKPKG